MRVYYRSKDDCLKSINRLYPAEDCEMKNENVGLCEIMESPEKISNFA
jgi:hypothetical protein